MTGTKSRKGRPEKKQALRDFMRDTQPGDEYDGIGDDPAFWQRFCESWTPHGFLVRGYGTDDCRLVDLGPRPRRVGKHMTQHLRPGDRRLVPSRSRRTAMYRTAGAVAWEESSEFGYVWVIRVS